MIMAAKNFSVFGIYTSLESAENAVDRLVAQSFCQDHISVLLRDNAGTSAFAHGKQTKVPEVAATKGAVAGGVIGGAIGLLAHIGVLAIPGLGPLIAVGPVIAALTGIGSGGMLGGILGAMVGIGIPEYEAKRYESRIRAGGILLSVLCENADCVGKAKDVLKQTGADDVASSEKDMVSHISARGMAT
jgi:hypothetical protein